MKTIVKSELAYHYGGANRGNSLWAGQSLYAGDALISSNGLFRLIYQADGNLVIYDWNDRPIWHSNTWGQPAGRATYQTDGNFVVYTPPPANKPIWASNNYSSESYRNKSRLVLDDNGNLRTTDNYQSQTWASNTGRVVPAGAVPSTVRARLAMAARDQVQALTPPG